MMIWKLLNLVALVGLLAVGAAGCNTFEGMGEDIEQGGEAISDTAEDAEDELED